jgi:glycine/D-amino acid oxidase-like deaminating enzyme
MKKCIVIGAGIIGASLAYHLASRGGRVTVLDAQPKMGGVATPNTWGWINASWGNPEPYAKLRMQSMRIWRQLGSIEDLQVNWCGALMWDVSPEDLKAYEKLHRDWGYGARLIDKAEALRLEPNLLSPPDISIHVAEEGVIEPDAAVRGFLNAALAFGAEAKAATPVQQLVMSAGRVTGVMVDGQYYEADEVIVAAGVESVALLQSIGLALPLKKSAAVVLYTAPAEAVLKGMIIPPDMELRQYPDGRLLAANNLVEGCDEKEVADETIAKIANILRLKGELKLDQFRVGYRPLPVDGFPLVGRMNNIEGLYVAVTHSGITLAPAIGAFGAEEILNGQRHELLAPYNLDRITAS